MQGDWKTKVDKNTQENWQDICGPTYKATTNEMGFRLLEFGTYNKLGLASQSILEMDVAFSERPASQPEQLHLAEMIPVWHNYCDDSEFSRRRCRK